MNVYVGFLVHLAASLLLLFFTQIYYEFRYLTWLYRITDDCLCTGGHLLFFFSPLLFLYGKSAFIILFFRIE